MAAAGQAGAKAAIAAILENHTESILADIPVDASEGASADMPCKYNERVEVGRDANGTPILRRASGNTKSELHQNIARVFAEYEAEVANGTKVTSESLAANTVLFGDYAKEWLETFKLVGLEEKTKHVYKSRMNRLIMPEFENMRIADLTSTGIQKWLNRLGEEGKAKATIRDTLNLLRQCLAAAVDDGLIDKSPADSKRITNPSKKVMKREPLTNAQWRDVVSSIPKLEDATDRRFMALLSFTSLRPGEVYGLRWEDFDFAGRFIHVQRAVSCATNQPVIKGPKTEAGVRLIPIADMLYDLLAPFGDEGYIFARENGELYTQQTQKRAWERIKKTVDVHGMTPYNWRHTFATNMIHSGADLDTTRSVMGHTDTRMTMKYVHTQKHHIAKAAAVMNAHFVQCVGGE